ncbi:MAG TPA: methyltransferase [Vicinamibacterales bacterium]|nr:methyltransferase [Vicinamibacterales bacterium]
MSSGRFSPSSRARLTTHDLGRFSRSTLFDRIGRALCDAGCLPRKELYESWEVARRARRLFRGGRVVDVAGGHGLLAHVMLLLDDTSGSAVVVDPARPSSAEAIHDTLVQAWPRLKGRVSYDTGDVGSFAFRKDDVVVSCHACGALTDRIIDAAAAARVRMAILPCCHDVDTCDAGDLTGWMDAALAIDAVRVMRLRERGYRVRTQVIPAGITPKNRLILAAI